LTEQSQRSSGRQADSRKRQERADRILDVAAELLLRWGYSKTTIDDIARAAGVAKGTIYLHWKTRDALFLALMQRERIALLDDVRQRIAAAPHHATLRGMIRESTLALLRRPLLRAVILRDMDLIGRLAHGEHHAVLSERAEAFAAYLSMMREQGFVRTDLPLRSQVYLVSAALTGFLFVRSSMPDAWNLSDDELAEVLAETVHRALEPDREPTSEVIPAALHLTTEYLDRDAALARTRLKRDLET
jgi:AcrR family transcriptional regulator